MPEQGYGAMGDVQVEDKDWAGTRGVDGVGRRVRRVGGGAGVWTCGRDGASLVGAGRGAQSAIARQASYGS